MQRRALLQHVRRYGCRKLREGGKHTVYWNPANRQSSTIPRHTEIADKLTYKICKDLGIPNP
jgi:predicted RNA binding protein YcfA (HicA-like mRNA interferase family)